MKSRGLTLRSKLRDGVQDHLTTCDVCGDMGKGRILRVCLWSLAVLSGAVICLALA